MRSHSLALYSRQFVFKLRDVLYHRTAMFRSFKRFFTRSSLSTNFTVIHRLYRPLFQHVIILNNFNDPQRKSNLGKLSNLLLHCSFSTALFPAVIHCHFRLNQYTAAMNCKLQERRKGETPSLLLGKLYFLYFYTFTLPEPSQLLYKR